jgi:hypothetical protein
MPIDAIDLRYTAPAACVDAPAFREGLLGLPRLPGAAPQGATITITITERDGGFIGDLRVEHSDGTTTARQVTSPRCDEVSDALELVAAVALGLDSTPLARPAPRPPAHPEKTGGQETGRPVSPPIASSPAVATAPPASPSPRWRFTGAVRGALLDGLGPRLEIAPEVALGVTLDAPGVFAPSFELSGTWATSGSIETSAGAATLTLWGGAVAACPVRIALGSRFAARPCAEVSAGVIAGSASGANVAPAPAQTEPRLALTPLVRLDWLVSRWFSVEAEAGPSFELSGDHFYFATTSSANSVQTPVYDLASVGSVTRLGVVVPWP